MCPIHDSNMKPSRNLSPERSVQHVREPVQQLRDQGQVPVPGVQQGVRLQERVLQGRERKMHSAILVPN